MFKTTLFGFACANSIIFVLLILFFNTTKAQSVVKTGKMEENCSQFLSSHSSYGDIINCVLIREKPVLVEETNSSAICINELASIIKEEDVLDMNLEVIMFVRYYKQFAVLYKNIT
ncbi:hypothetical protein [Flavobacterium taihuense]|uniref:Uncharacterized protein n=1 Tax=Flavobacterium taihuense TaxID=2857508 RepID=A0ABS6XS07_9FLAO|nr:hypothetical protein [Flavobacterium taihuense]MBW4359394.1 hypothetical protein [Flavobacterium taihuense]